MIRAALALFLSLLLAAQAAAFDTKARAALVVDMMSGAVLLEKNADTPIPPASMSKLMTLNMVFEALEQGRLIQGYDDANNRVQITAAKG